MSADYIAALEMPTLWRGAIQYLDTGHTPQMEDPAGFSDLVAALTADVTGDLLP